MLGESSSEAELDAAIEAELAKMDPEEAERVIREFAAEEGSPYEPRPPRSPGENDGKQSVPRLRRIGAGCLRPSPIMPSCIVALLSRG
jgi:hypothetical protein